MDKLNLPAKKQKSNHELSANQFQEKLYNWFHEQGLLSELRGHLRMQMVTALQDGPTSSSSSKFSISPKVQALSVLVADFLLQQGFNYSLSVYVTEVPIIGQIFSQFTHSAVRKLIESGNILGQSFSIRDVEDIFETLGFAPGSELCTQALSFYQDNSLDGPSDPLLLCIFRAFTFMDRKENRNLDIDKNNKSLHNIGLLLPPENRRQPRSSKEEPNDLKDQWMNEMEDIMLQNNIKISHINYLQNYMKKVHEEELWKVREEEAAKYQKMLDEKLKECDTKDTKEKQVREWKEKVEADLIEREKNLCQLAGQLRRQHEEISEKLMYLEMESEQMRIREKQIKEEQEKRDKELSEKKSDVDIHQDKIKKAYERLAADQEILDKMKEDLFNKQKERENEVVVMRAEVDSMKGIDFLKQVQEQYSNLAQMISNVQNVPGTTIDPLPSIQVSTEDKGLQTTAALTSSVVVDSDLLGRIEEEKRELREHVVQQRRRIDELTVRAADLANQLQDAQVALQLVTPNQLAITTPPLTAPLTLRVQPRPNWPPHIGSGEQTTILRPAVNLQPATLTTNDNQSASTSSAVQRRTEARRRTSRRPSLLQSSSKSFLSSDDSSTTEDMIQEARARLRRLEEESSTINEEFQNRQTAEPTTTSVHFHPEQSRVPNLFDGLRQNAPYNPFRQPRDNSRNFSTRISNLVTRPTFEPLHPGYQFKATGYRPTPLRSIGSEEEDDAKESRLGFFKSIRKEKFFSNKEKLFSDKKVTLSDFSRKLLQNTFRDNAEKNNTFLDKSKIFTKDKKDSKLQFSKTVTIVTENKSNDSLQKFTNSTKSHEDDQVSSKSDPEQKKESVFESQENLSVEVLLQRNIRSSSSSTQPSQSSQPYENQDYQEANSQSSNSERRTLLVTQSLPARSPKSFFSIEGCDYVGIDSDGPHNFLNVKDETEGEVKEVESKEVIKEPEKEPLAESKDVWHDTDEEQQNKKDSLVPLLNFSGTSVGVNTSDENVTQQTNPVSWREPGDGTDDIVHTDSDEQLSVGSDESSSSVW